MTEYNRARLVRMLAEGRITKNQYEEFVANLPEEGARSHPPEPIPESPRRGVDSKIPWYIIACAVFLFLMSVVLVPIALAGLHGDASKLGMLVAAAVNFLIALGLLKRSRIAFIVGVALAGLAAVGCMFGGNLPGSVGNLVFVAFLLPGYRWFFPDGLTGKTSSSE